MVVPGGGHVSSLLPRVDLAIVRVDTSLGFEVVSVLVHHEGLAASQMDDIVHRDSDGPEHSDWELPCLPPVGGPSSPELCGGESAPLSVTNRSPSHHKEYLEKYI